MGTITKALELLDFFSRIRPEIGLGDFVRLAGRDKATVHRHLTELAENGFLEQDPVTRAYRLGPAILRLSGVREATHPARSLIRPVVLRLAGEVGELAHASILQGAMLSPLVHADPKIHGTQVSFDEGEMLPLHATASGLAVLAFSSLSFAERVLSGELKPFTEATVTDPATLSEMIADVREAGISGLAQAFDDEVTSHAAPIFGPNGAVIGALSVAVPTIRMTDEKRAQIRDALRRGVVAASRAMGGTIPAAHQSKWAVTA